MMRQLELHTFQTLRSSPAARRSSVRLLKSRYPAAGCCLTEVAFGYEAVVLCALSADGH